MITDRQDIQVQIDGEGIHLETLSLRDLTEYLLSLEDAILANAEVDGLELPPPGQQPCISLIGVEENCVMAKLAIMAILIPSLATVTKAISSNTISQLPESVRMPVTKIVQHVTRNNQTFRIEAIPQQNVSAAVITPELMYQCQIDAAPPPPTRSETTIYGRCISVGGVRKPQAEIRLSSGGAPIKAYGNEQQIRLLGHLIFDEVRIDGVGLWNMPDWDLESIEITHVEAHPYVSPVDAFNELRSSSSSYWKGVDARTFIKKVRHG